MIGPIVRRLEVKFMSLLSPALPSNPGWIFHPKLSVNLPGNCTFMKCFWGSEFSILASNGGSRTFFEFIVQHKHFLMVYYAPATMVGARDAEINNHCLPGA